MTNRLRAADAVAALILVEGGGYLLQRRDQRGDIWYPGHWGLFGGAIDAGEEPLAALARELREELELDLDLATVALFAKFDFAIPGLGLAPFFRSYYTVPISRTVLAGLVLHEGAEMRVFAAPDLLADAPVTPYDSFALFLHHARRRLGAAG